MMAPQPLAHRLLRTSSCYPDSGEIKIFKTWFTREGHRPSTSSLTTMLGVILLSRTFGVYNGNMSF